MENMTIASVNLCDNTTFYRKIINIYQNGLNGDLDERVKDEIEIIFKEFLYSYNDEFREYFTKELTHDLNNDLKNLNLEKETFNKLCDLMESYYDEYTCFAYEIIYDNNKYHMFISHGCSTCMTSFIIMDNNKNIKSGEIYETMMKLYEINEGILFICDNTDKIITLLLNNNNKNEIMEKLKNKYEEEKDDKDNEDIINDIVNMYS